MHILFSSWSARGHVNPMVPMMQAAHKAGHKVTYETYDLDESSIKWLTAEGILGESGFATFVSSGTCPCPMGYNETVEFLMKHGGKMRGQSAYFDAFGEHLFNHFDTLERYFAVDKKDTMPDCVIAECSSPGSLDFAEKHNIPRFVVYPNYCAFDNSSLCSSTPARFSGNTENPRGFSWLSNIGAKLLERKVRFEWLGNRLNKHRLRNGLPERQDAFPFGLTAKSRDDRTFICYNARGFEFDSCLPVTEEDKRKLILCGGIAREVKEKIEGELKSWVDNVVIAGGRCILYVAMGTVHPLSRYQVETLARTLVAVCAKQPIAVLWALRNRDLLPKDTLDKFGSTLPVYIVNFAPQNAVLLHPSTFSFISHCGASSVLESMMAGCPLICMPLSGDQPSNAARVVGRKAGITVGASPSPRTLLRGIEQMYTQRAEFKARAEGIQKILSDAGGCDFAIQEVEKRVKEHVKA